jgi:hypothetical protein
MRAALVVAVLLSSGCAMEHCGASYDELTWRDMGLYASITGAEPAALVTWDPGNGALGWNGTPPWPGAKLWRVGMPLPRPHEEPRGMFMVPDPHVMSLGLERDGVLVGMVEGNVSDDVVRSLFGQAVANLTRPGFDADAAWLEFRASRSTSSTFVAVPLDDEATAWEERQHWHHHVSLAGWIDVDRLASRLDLPPATVTGIGYAESTADGWAFTWTLPTWTIDGSRDDTHGILRVDSAGQAMLRLAPGAESVEELRAEARSFLAFVGLEADLDEASASGSSC